MEAIRTYPDEDSLAQAAADHFLASAGEAVAARGRFAVALSGGRTPKRLYELLARPPWRQRIPWTQVHIFWSDERCVPPNHPDSNYRLARETFLDQIPISAVNVHRIRGELPPVQAAQIYRAELQDVLGDEGRFDLILLGLGTDGHTASLFPGTTALQEQEHPAVAVYVEKLQAWRVTLTPPTINAARHVTFIVAGASKAKRLREVLHGSHRREVLPAQIIRPREGHLLWLLDRAAATGLHLTEDERVFD